MHLEFQQIPAHYCCSVEQDWHQQQRLFESEATYSSHLYQRAGAVRLKELDVYTMATITIQELQNST